MLGSRFYVFETHIDAPGTHFCVSGAHFYVPRMHFYISGTHIDAFGAHCQKSKKPKNPRNAFKHLYTHLNAVKHL